MVNKGINIPSLARMVLKGENITLREIFCSQCRGEEEIDSDLVAVIAPRHFQNFIRSLPESENCDNCYERGSYPLVTFNTPKDRYVYSRPFRKGAIYPDHRIDF